MINYWWKKRGASTGNVGNGRKTKQKLHIISVEMIFSCLMQMPAHRVLATSGYIAQCKKESVMQTKPCLIPFVEEIRTFLKEIQVT